MSVQVLQPYSGYGHNKEHDIFFILRPQVNHYYFESLLLSVFRTSPEYKKSIWLIYLANIPGYIIRQKKILEHRYEYRIFFAKYGAKEFSDSMLQRFTAFFNVSLESSRVYGGFEAIDICGFTPVELFALPYTKILKMSGQSVIQTLDKNGDTIYIINHDIPALLTFYQEGTNSAVFMFRTILSYQEFNRIVMQVVDNITQKIIVEDTSDKKTLQSLLSKESIEVLKGSDFYRHKRIFHFSHGPFEQILDAQDVLYKNNEESSSLEEYTFTQYLLNRGVRLKDIRHMLKNPIIGIKEDNKVIEESLYIYTRNMSFDRSYELLQNVVYHKNTQCIDTILS